MVQMILYIFLNDCKNSQKKLIHFHKGKKNFLLPTVTISKQHRKVKIYQQLSGYFINWHYFCWKKYQDLNKIK